MATYITLEMINDLIAEINSSKKTSREIGFLSQKVEEYYNSINLNIKIFYFADTEYIKALRDLKSPNPIYLNDGLPKGLELLLSKTIKDKIDKQQKNLNTDEEDKLIEKIQIAVKKLSYDFEREKAEWDAFAQRYSSVANRMALEGERLENDIAAVKEDLKIKIKQRDLRIFFIALVFYYIGFAADKLLDSILPDAWYLTVLSSIIIFALGYWCIDKTKDNFVNKAKIASLNTQLTYLKAIVQENETKITRTCNELNLTFDQLVIELAALIKKLHSLENIYQKK